MKAGTFSIKNGIFNNYYLPRRSLGKYSTIFTEPEVNNCFTIIFKGECEKLEENLAKHKKQMWLSLAIMPRNPIITAGGLACVSRRISGCRFSPPKITFFSARRVKQEQQNPDALAG